MANKPRNPTVKALKKASREQNKLPQAKIISPNKKQYKRKPKKQEVNLSTPAIHIGWPDWWMD
jgi:hypothetical protein